MEKDVQTKQIIFGENVRKKILQGVQITERVVATTLGSKGRNVALELNWDDPIVIHDGVTAARAVYLKDPFANMGAQLVIRAAQNTNTDAGDGTTTATILTRAIVEEGLRAVGSGVNPMVIRKGIEKAKNQIIVELKKMAKEVKSPEEMIQIANISAADESLGTLIAGAIQKVGESGVVTVQEGRGSKIEVEYKEGMEFNKGMIAPYEMRTDKEKLLAEYTGENAAEYPYVIIFNEKLTQEKLLKLIAPVVNKNNQAKLLIIADEYDQYATITLALNAQRGYHMVAVESPEFGDHRKNLLEDIATVTGGKVIGGVSGLPLDSVIDSSNFGRADKVIVKKDQTIIVGGQGEKSSIEARIDGLKAERKASKDFATLDKLESRISRLVGGVAVINVGAASQAEMREVKERVIDAVNATRAAIEEGIVPGGGIALARASMTLDQLMVDDPAANVGIKIVKDAVTYPFKKLVENAGVDPKDSGYFLKTCLASSNLNLGYNVDTDKLEDMYKSGIIDPVKVTRSALENAVSCASMLLTTEVMITFDRNRPKEKQERDENELGIGHFTD